MRPEDTAARMGGDEFVVLLPNIEGVATAVAERILERMRPLFRALNS